jgi:hypothetical protein
MRFRTFMQAVAAENKNAAKKLERVNALQSIDYLGFQGHSRFDGVYPRCFAFQLALRVREPSLINQ